MIPGEEKNVAVMTRGEGVAFKTVAAELRRLMRATDLLLSKNNLSTQIPLLVPYTLSEFWRLKATSPQTYLRGFFVLPRVIPTSRHGIVRNNTKETGSP